MLRDEITGVSSIMHRVAPALASRFAAPGTRTLCQSTSKASKFNTWAKGYRQHFFNIGMSFLTCVLASQLLGLKLQRDDAKAELEATKAVSLCLEFPRRNTRERASERARDCLGARESQARYQGGRSDDRW